MVTLASSKLLSTKPRNKMLVNIQRFRQRFAKQLSNVKLARYARDLAGDDKLLYINEGKRRKNKNK